MPPLLHCKRDCRGIFLLTTGKKSSPDPSPDPFHHAVTANSRVGDNVRQNQWRLRNHAARGPMRLCHRHSDGPDFEFLNARR